MTPEKLFHELLGLGTKWEVTSCEFDREDGTVRLAIRETPDFWKAERSPGEGEEVTCYDHTEEVISGEKILRKAHYFSRILEVPWRISPLGLTHSRGAALVFAIMTRSLLMLGLVFAVLAGGCAAPCQPKPRFLPKVNVAPLALDPAFSFRKTKLFFHDHKLDLRSNSDMVSFERERLNFKTVSNQDMLAREGHYFDFWWRAERTANVTVRLEYRQQNLGAFVQAQEVDVPAACGTIETKFQVIGDSYHQDGRVTAWRALIIEKGKVVALTQSFLWN